MNLCCPKVSAAHHLHPQLERGLQKETDTTSQLYIKSRVLEHFLEVSMVSPWALTELSLGTAGVWRG